MNGKRKTDRVIDKEWQRVTERSRHSEGMRGCRKGREGRREGGKAEWF